MSNLVNGLNSLNHALPAYLESEAYYNGSVSEIFSTDVLRKVLGRSYNHFTLNYARQVVTSRLSRMEVSSISSEDATANKLLEEVWRKNAMDQEIQDALEGSLIYGDAYLIAWPDPERTNVDVFYNDPKNTRLFYDPENPRKKSYAIKRWQDGERLRINLYFADRIEKYISVGKLTSTFTEGDFEEYWDEGQTAWPLVNDTGEVPVFHLRTGRMYGRSELEDAKGAQNDINKLVTVQIAGVDYNSFPQRYILENPADGVNPQQDFQNSDFGQVRGTMDLDDNYDSGNLGALKGSPGGVWSLKNVASVGQFDATPPDTFVTPFNTFVNALATTTQTPMHLFQIGSLPSGESLRAAEAPLNKRVESLELLFGGVLREMHEFILGLVGMDGVSVSVVWAPVATYNDSTMWATVEAKTSAGVPLEVALKESGYTQAQIDEWYPEGAATVRTTGQLVKVADALQKISAAQALGVITREEARNLLPQDFLSAQPTVDPNSILDALAPQAGTAVDQGGAMATLISAGVDPHEAAQRVGLVPAQPVAKA